MLLHLCLHELTAQKANKDWQWLTASIKKNLETKNDNLLNREEFVLLKVNYFWYSLDFLNLWELKNNVQLVSFKHDNYIRQ